MNSGIKRNIFKLDPKLIWSETDFPRHLYMDLNSKQFLYDLAESIQEAILKRNQIDNYLGIHFLNQQKVIELKKESIGKDMVFIEPLIFFEKIQNQFFIENNFGVIEEPPRWKIPRLESMGVKFTKSPWRLLQPSSGIDLNWHVSDESDTFVAHVYGFNHSVDLQSFYNAQLIKFAPELFEVVCQLLWALNDKNKPTEEEKDIVFVRAMAIKNCITTPDKDFENLAKVHEQSVKP